MSSKNVVNLWNGQSEWNTAQSLLASVDLIAAAKKQIQFLALVDNTPALRKPEVLERAVDRYWNNWLPLAFKFQSGGFPDSGYSQSGAGLLPPLDCAWIWHCHKLSPVRYANDCKRFFGELIDIKDVPSGGSAHSELERASSNWWQTDYPKEPYHLVQALEDGTSTEFQDLLRLTRKHGNAHVNKSYDFLAAAARQAPFYYQVRRSWFTDHGFLEVALQRYKGYLYLIQQALKRRRENDPPVFLVPTYDIDLMWHSHQLHPSAYARDTTSLIGKVLDHDDTDSDRSVGQKLHNGYVGTCHRWWKTFGTVYERAGAMYKGPEPADAAPPPPKDDIKVVLEEQRVEKMTSKGTWDSSSFESHMKSAVDDTLTADLRSTMEVHLVILSARNVPHPERRYKEEFHVRVTALAKCPILSLNTCKEPSNDNRVEWNHGFAMEAEKATRGLQLELICTRKKKRIVANRCCCGGPLATRQEPEHQVGIKSDDRVRSGDTSMGKVCILWSDPDFYSSQPGLSSTKSKVLSIGLVELQYSISVTPSQRAPKVLRSLHSPVTDDDCKRISLHIEKTESLQPGRWTTKTVVNHNGTPTYLIRARSEHFVERFIHNLSSSMSGCAWENTMVKIHEAVYTPSRYVGVDVGAGEVKGTAQILATEYHKSRSNQFRQWSLFSDGAILTVRRPTKRKQKEIDVELYGKCGAHPMRLLPGRKLDYAIGGDYGDDKYLTLVRYTPDAPKGQATALLNLSQACYEVMPGESSVLVLLISSAVSMSLHSLGHQIDGRLNWDVNSRDNSLVSCSSDGHLGAIRLHSNPFSQIWTPSRTERRHRNLQFLHLPWWQGECRHWEFRQQLNGAQCRPAACAGAACGGNQLPSRPATTSNNRGAGCGGVVPMTGGGGDGEDGDCGCGGGGGGGGGGCGGGCGGGGCG